MEPAGQGSYRQLAEEIGAVLQSAAETAEKMLEDARAEAGRIRAQAEAEHRSALAEGRRIIDEAGMDADMLRAEAEWQAQEIIAQARHLAADRVAGADSRLAEVEKAEGRVLERLAGVGQVVADTLAALREVPLREGQSDTAAPGATAAEVAAPDDNADRPDAKVYFVEFPPAAPPEPSPAPALPDPEEEIVLSERSEWAPPTEMPTWWTRDGVQG